MDEEKSMSERILDEIEYILNNDTSVREFCIIPVEENKNKSPVLYQEHNLGLESWCVKYVYKYLHSELFKSRQLLKKNRLPNHRVKFINKFLIGALLIHPDVSTFWNMRRELVHYGEINLDKELLLSKLVLSNKTKSNEAFAYRKWILTRLLKTIDSEDFDLAMALLDEEFYVTGMAAGKSQNNYHAWSHRIWSIENIVSKSCFTELPDYINLIFTELDFSMKWIDKHVSEHAGFHYRQYVCKGILMYGLQSGIPNCKYLYITSPYIGINYSNSVAYLNSLLGKTDSVCEPRELLIKCDNYVNYILVLLADLLFFMKSLNETFPEHESIWYHRRFVIFHLLKVAYDYHGLIWNRRFDFNESYLTTNSLNSCNIIYNNIEEKCKRMQENGEKCPKLPKYELNKVESSHLYKILVRSECKFIDENTYDECSRIQKDLAKKYQKWLKFVLCFNKI